MFYSREITFDNAEELTEEGLPLMVLFYHPNNTLPIKEYKEKIEAELISEKRKKLYYNIEIAKIIRIHFLTYLSCSNRKHKLPYCRWQTLCPPTRTFG